MLKMDEKKIGLTEHGDESEVVRRAQDGDAAAIVQLYDTHKQFLYVFVYSKVGNREEAEDLTQDIWMKVLDSLVNFQFQSKFRTWLCQVGKFTIADYWRKTYKSKSVPLDDLMLNSPALATKPRVEEEDGEGFKQFHQRMNLLENILRQLPEHYREVLEYRFVKNFTLKQTAEAMNKTENNIKVLQFRAIKKATVLADKIYGNEQI